MQVPKYSIGFLQLHCLAVAGLNHANKIIIELLVAPCPVLGTTLTTISIKSFTWSPVVVYSAINYFTAAI
jgi:hypothetical protein